MTARDDFLAGIVADLDRAAIAYMITGSFGSSFHGEPRATNDVDIVIDATPEQLDRFLDSLDVPYLKRWARELGVQDLLESLLTARDGA